MLPRGPRTIAGLLTAVAALGAARLASAKCPNEDPGNALCEPRASMLMPSVFGEAYFPHGTSSPYAGGGFELALLSWVSNNDAFGPSHGRVRADVAYMLGSSDSRALSYTFGAVVSFEGNASRRFLIPYYGVAIGGLWASQLGSRVIADASLGLYLVTTRHFVLDLEGGVVLPFADVDTLVGPRAQMTAAFALW